MNIGDASAYCGFPAKTIRCYEDIGLVQPERRANGYRDYGDDEVRRLRFVQRARSLGFTIDDCRLLLELLDDEARASADVKIVASRHLEEVNHNIQKLEVLRGCLRTVVDACPGDELPHCPILDELVVGPRP